MCQAWTTQARRGADLKNFNRFQRILVIERNLGMNHRQPYQLHDGIVGESIAAPSAREACSVRRVSSARRSISPWSPADYAPQRSFTAAGRTPERQASCLTGRSLQQPCVSLNYLPNNFAE